MNIDLQHINYQFFLMDKDGNSSEDITYVPSDKQVIIGYRDKWFLLNIVDTKITIRPSAILASGSVGRIDKK